MARKPKAQPSPEAAVDDAPAPARRGPKPKAAAASPELPLALGDDGVTDEAETGATPSAPTDTPRRKGPGRKPKSPNMAAVAPLLEDDAGPQQDPKPGTAEPELAPDSIEANASEIEAPPEVATADSADPIQPDAGPDTPADDAQQPLPGLEALGPRHGHGAVRLARDRADRRGGWSEPSDGQAADRRSCRRRQLALAAVARGSDQPG